MSSRGRFGMDFLGMWDFVPIDKEVEVWLSWGVKESRDDYFWFSKYCLLKDAKP